MTSADEASSFSCPSTPISGRRMCREYRRSWSSFMGAENRPRNELRFASVPFRGDKAARFFASALSILGGCGRRALRGGERHALQQLERLLELEVLFRGELERCGRLFFRIDRWFCAGALRFLGLGFPLLLVEEMLFQIGFTQASRGGRRGILDQDVGHDAFGLDRAPARGVVAGGGQLDRGVVASGKDRIH